VGQLAGTLFSWGRGKERSVSGHRGRIGKWEGGLHLNLYLRLSGGFSVLLPEGLGFEVALVFGGFLFGPHFFVSEVSVSELSGEGCEAGIDAAGGGHDVRVAK
jgi:hypothetical protein